MGIELKSHNEQAYRQVKEILAHANRAAVIHPTGTGKTYIALKLIEETEGRTIYVAPSNPILKQVKKTIENAYARGEIDEAEYRRYNELEYVTYKSLMELSKIESGYANIILDEFHRCGAPEWGKGVRRLLDNNKEAKILGLTATPKRAVDNRDMADELFEGNIASEMTLEEAVAEGIIQAPTYINAIYSLNEVIMETESRIERLEDESKKAELRQKIGKVKRQLETAEGIESIFEKYASKKDGKYIVFCNDIKDMHKKMQEASKWFSKVGDVKIYEVSYRKSEEVNEETLEMFGRKDEKVNLLFSVNKLNEGVHVDGIDGVIMLRKTSSPIVYMQQLGRALSAGNTGTPLVFDLVNNIESSQYVYSFMERVQQERAKRGIEDEKIGNIEIIEIQREVKEILAEISEKLERWHSIEETLRVCQILHDNGVDLEKVKWGKKVLSEIEQKGIDIGRIIEENGLDGNFKIGQKVDKLRKVYRGTGTGRITEDERRQVEELGIIPKEQESVISEILKVCQILHANGVDLEKVKWGKKVLSEIKQKDIDIERIIEENGLDGTFKIGKKVAMLKERYRGTANGGTITPDERRQAEELGIIPKEQESAIAKTLRVCHILHANGVDLEKVVWSKKVNGKSVYKILLEIEPKGIDIERIIEENGLEGDFEIGEQVKNLRRVYRGTANGAITPNERRQVEELGIIPKEKESAVAETLRVCQILHANGVDLEKVSWSKKENGKQRELLLSEIEPKGIDIERIIEENGLDVDFKIGQKVTDLKRAYRGTGTCTITEEEKKLVEELSIVNSKKEKVKQLKSEDEDLRQAVEEAQQLEQAYEKELEAREQGKTNEHC